MRTTWRSIEAYLDERDDKFDELREVCEQSAMLIDRTDVASHRECQAAINQIRLWLSDAMPSWQDQDEETEAHS